MKPFKVGIEAYSLKPLGLSPFALLDWAKTNDAHLRDLAQAASAT